MTNFGGKHSEFEKLLEANLKALDALVSVHTSNISKILKEAYNKPKASKKYWNDVRKKLDREYEALDRLFRTWSSKTIPTAYGKTVKSIMDTLNKNKAIAKMASQSYTSLVTNTKSKDIVAILVADAVADYSEALMAGKQTLVKLTRKTQQTLISEALINPSIIESIESGNLMNNTYIKTASISESLASQLDQLAEVIDGKKYVVAGSKRFSPKYYAEMVTRVKFHEAQAQASIQTALSYGTSLVQVSSHNTTTPLCMVHEGKIYSVDGKDSRFPRLMDVPPYHVNCLHLLFPMFESGMEADGSLEGWIDFSSGKSSVPPSPSNFVPVSKRG